MSKLDEDEHWSDWIPIDYKMYVAFGSTAYKTNHQGKKEDCQICNKEVLK